MCKLSEEEKKEAKEKSVKTNPAQITRTVTLYAVGTEWASKERERQGKEEFKSPTDSKNALACCE